MSALPDKAAPGPPPVIWSPYLANPYEKPWRPGLAVWHRAHGVWVTLMADDLSGNGRVAPDHAILLTPEHAPTGVAELAARIALLEQAISESPRR